MGAVAAAVATLVLVWLIHDHAQQEHRAQKLRGAAPPLRQKPGASPAPTRRASRRKQPLPSPLAPEPSAAGAAQLKTPPPHHVGIAAEEHDHLFAHALSRLDSDKGGSSNRDAGAATAAESAVAPSDAWLDDWLSEGGEQRAAEPAAKAQSAHSAAAASLPAVATAAADPAAAAEAAKEAQWKRMFDLIVASPAGKTMSAEEIAAKVFRDVESAERAQARKARAGRLRVARIKQAAMRPKRKIFTPSFASLRTHTLPKWYDDAKLGVVVNWGVFSVPAWAPVVAGGGADFRDEGCRDGRRSWACNPDATWYANSAHIPGSPTAKHHAASHPGKTYADFAREFAAASAQWTPDAWMETFAEASVGYVVFAAKQPDGFCMWPTKITHPTLSARGFAGTAGAPASAQRDFVGETLSAARKRGMKTGISYSGGLDWNFNGIFAQGGTPHVEDSPFRAAATPSMPPPSGFHAYALAQWRELDQRYKPDVLSNDVGFPELFGWSKIVADAYNTRPTAVINDRFVNPYAGGDFESISTDSGLAPDTLLHLHRKWELTRPLGGSLGYNRNEITEQYLSVQHLVHVLVEVISRGGNLLLSIGPKASGELPREQTELLLGLGAWLKPNREAVFGTRTWSSTSAVQCCAETKDAKKVRFTASPDQSVLYVIVLADLHTAGRSRARLVRIKPVREPSRCKVDAHLLRDGKAQPIEHWFESQASGATRKHGSTKQPVLVLSFPTGLAIEGSYAVRLNCTSGGRFEPTETKKLID